MKIERLNLYSIEDIKNTEERRKINEIIALVNELQIKVKALEKAKSED